MSAGTDSQARAGFRLNPGNLLDECGALREGRVVMIGSEGWHAGQFQICHASNPTRAARRRSALPITETDERLIAAAAITGDSSNPVKG